MKRFFIIQITLWLNNIKFISINGIFYLNKIGLIKLDNHEEIKLKKLINNSNFFLLKKIELLVNYLLNIFKFKLIKVRDFIQNIF